MRVGEALHRLFERAPTRVSFSEGYTRWAPLYPPHPHNRVMEVEAAIVAPMFRAAAPRRALDVGTGTGRNLEMLRSAGARTAIGVDLSLSMLSQGRSSDPRAMADARHLPFASGIFDVVSSSLMCGDVPEPAEWIAEAARVLTRGGHLIYSDFHPSWATAGWRRTFKGDDGVTYQLPYFSHEVEQHLEVLKDCGLEVQAIREPRIEGFSAPAVVVLHAMKPGRR